MRRSWTAEVLGRESARITCYLVEAGAGLDRLGGPALRATGSKTIVIFGNGISHGDDLIREFGPLPGDVLSYSIRVHPKRSWSEHGSRSTGKAFYFNAVTKQSTYVKPLGWTSPSRDAVDLKGSVGTDFRPEFPREPSL